jgi:hypothetical protein
MENIHVNQQVQRNCEKNANKCIFIITILKNENCEIFPFILSKNLMRIN